MMTLHIQTVRVVLAARIIEELQNSRSSFDFSNEIGFKKKSHAKLGLGLGLVPFIFSLLK